MANKKLFTEIDRTLKKCAEGILNYDDIHSRIEECSSNQRERLESDLKKEIKKLQKYRDTIKQWCNNDLIKDKSHLKSMRRQIEERMESFKKCEKETKTKAYSKEALRKSKTQTLNNNDSNNKGVLTYEQSESKQWFDQQIASLLAQNHDLDTQLEKYQSSTRRESKKHRNKKNNLFEINKINERLERNKWHLGQLELCLNRILNSNISALLYKDIKDDVEYYVDESIDDEEYNQYHDDEMYHIVLNAEADIAHSNHNHTDNDDDDIPIKTQQTPPINLKSNKKNNSKKNKNKNKPKNQIKHRKKSKPKNSPSVSSVHSARSDLSNSMTVINLNEQNNKNISQQLLQQPLKVNGHKNNNSNHNKPQPPPPLQPQPPPPLQPPPQPQPQPPPPQQRPMIPPINRSKPPMIPPITVTDNDLPPFSRTLSHKEADILDIINVGYQKRPKPLDTHQPSFYKPDAPYCTPTYFPKERRKMFDATHIFGLMDLDTLFFIFYYQSGSYQQFIAAKELKMRGWSFNRRYSAWFQRHYNKQQNKNKTEGNTKGNAKGKDKGQKGGDTGGELLNKNETRSLKGKGQHIIVDNKYERGTYIFFDRNQSWQMRMRENFKFDYEYLEDDVNVNVDDKLDWNKLATYGNGCGLIYGEQKQLIRWHKQQQSHSHSHAVSNHHQSQSVSSTKKQHQISQIQSKSRRNNVNSNQSQSQLHTARSLTRQQPPQLTPNPNKRYNSTHPTRPPTSFHQSQNSLTPSPHGTHQRFRPPIQHRSSQPRQQNQYQANNPTPSQNNVKINNSNQYSSRR